MTGAPKSKSTSEPTSSTKVKPYSTLQFVFTALPASKLKISLWWYYLVPRFWYKQLPVHATMNYFNHLLDFVALVTQTLVSAPSSYLARELVALHVLRFKTPAQLSASLQHLFVWTEMHYSNNQNIVAINLIICRRNYIALSPQFRDFKWGGVN